VRVRHPDSAKAEEGTLRCAFYFPLHVKMLRSSARRLFVFFSIVHGLLAIVQQPVASS